MWSIRRYHIIISHCELPDDDPPMTSLTSGIGGVSSESVCVRERERERERERFVRGRKEFELRMEAYTWILFQRLAEERANAIHDMMFAVRGGTTTIQGIYVILYVPQY